MLSLPPPARDPDPSLDPGPVDWADIEARTSRAAMHLRNALADIKGIARHYGNAFGCLSRPADIELRARHAWASTIMLRDQARGHLDEEARRRNRAASTPLWLVNKHIDELDTARLVPTHATHPPPGAPRITRGPYTGRMKMFEEPPA